MKKLLVLILFLKGFSTCFAQEDSLKAQSEWKIWAAAGSGIGLGSHELNFPFKIFVAKNEHSILSRGQSCFDVGFGTKHPYIRLTEVGLLYAYNTSMSTEIGKAFYVVGGGIGYLNGIGRGKLLNDEEDYERVIVSTFGLTLEAQIVRPFASWFGVGASAYANINPQYIIYGVNWSFHLGKVQ